MKPWNNPGLFYFFGANKQVTGKLNTNNLQWIKRVKIAILMKPQEARREV
jgi:hypothetical protein